MKKDKERARVVKVQLFMLEKRVIAVDAPRALFSAFSSYALACSLPSAIRFR